MKEDDFQVEILIFNIKGMDSNFEIGGCFTTEQFRQRKEVTGHRAQSLSRQQSGRPNLPGHGKNRTLHVMQQ